MSHSSQPGRPVGKQGPGAEPRARLQSPCPDHCMAQPPRTPHPLKTRASCQPCFTPVTPPPCELLLLLPVSLNSVPYPPPHRVLPTVSPSGVWTAAAVGPPSCREVSTSEPGSDPVTVCLALHFLLLALTTSQVLLLQCLRPTPQKHHEGRTRPPVPTM